MWHLLSLVVVERHLFHPYHSLEATRHVEQEMISQVQMRVEVRI
jgi:hypothetical protein